VASRGAAVGIGLGIGALAAAGFAITYLASRKTPGSGSGGTGGGGGAGGGGGGVTSCTTDAECPSCQFCIGGECGARIPYAAQVTSNDGGSQDEQVASVGVPFTNIAVCDWSSLSFYPYNQNSYSVQARLVDVSGNGVPCTQLSAQFESSSLEVVAVSPTDSDGFFTVTYQLAGPFQGNAGCPGPGQTVTTTAVVTLDFLLPSGALIGSTVCTVTVFITGV
jgi:hypothetical protein